jgi:hypothetical protein
VRATVLLGLVATIVLLGSGVAVAAESHQYDTRGDAAPGVDMTRVTYVNAPRHVTARIHIPGLQRRGRAILEIGPPVATDFWDEAVLTIGADGRLVKRFRLSTDTGTFPAKCHFRGRWDAARGLITVAVPQVCVRGFEGTALYLRATTRAGSHHDYAPSVTHLRRG